MNDEVDSTRAMGRLTAEPNAPCAYESAVNKYHAPASPSHTAVKHPIRVAVALAVALPARRYI